jgi:hypothetical protein
MKGTPVKTRLRVLAVGAALVAGLGAAQLPFAGSAAAGITNCDLTFTPTRAPTTVKMICWDGTGQYRIEVDCHDGISGITYKRYGAWEYLGLYSTATCAAPQRQTITGYGEQFR